MKKLIQVVFVLWDILLYWKFVYPLWESHIIFIFFFLPIGIVVAYFFTKGDGKSRFKDLITVHAILRSILTVTILLAGGTDASLLLQSSNISFLTGIIGFSAVFYTAFLLLNLKALFSSTSQSPELHITIK